MTHLTTVRQVQIPIGACSMTQAHSIWPWRTRLFRVFVNNAYYANREEYELFGQTQTQTFEQYTSTNLQQLKQAYKAQLRK